MEKSRQSNYQGNSMRGGRVRIQTSWLTREFTYEWFCSRWASASYSFNLTWKKFFDRSFSSSSSSCCQISLLYHCIRYLIPFQIILSQKRTIAAKSDFRFKPLWLWHQWWMMQRTSTGERRGLSPTIGMCITLEQGVLVTEHYSCCICHASVIHFTFLVRNLTYTVLAKRSLPTATS